MVFLSEAGRGLIDFARRQPLRRMGVILAVLVLLSAANFALHASFPGSLHTPRWFLLPQSPGLSFNSAGLPYAAAFLLLLFLVVRVRRMRDGILQAWLVGLAFILLGNMIQGSVYPAFKLPVIGSQFQYYNDALKIKSWTDWLANFNADQAGLFLHSRTHPPFAVLFHYMLIQVLGNRPLQVAAVIIFFASLSIPIVSRAFAELGLGPEAGNGLAILFGLLPAVNIYTAVSLDAIVMTACAVFLLGMLMLIRRPGYSLLGLTLFVAGILLMNLLTFAGAFAFAVGAVVGGLEWLAKRGRRILGATALGVLLFGLVIWGLAAFGHYNHVQAFFAASRLENPDGFQAVADPLNYVLTRLEGAGEIAFFFSIGCLALSFRGQPGPWSAADVAGDASRIVLAGTAVLGLMLVAGINPVGETARTCLFIYPFLMLFFFGNDGLKTRDLMVLAGLQTMLMQLLSTYFW